MVDENKMLNFSKWIPNKSDLDWTEQFLNNQKDGFIWITSHYSLKINKQTKLATFLDINFKVMKEKPLEPFEDVSRILKVLVAIGWKYIIPKNKEMVMNLDMKTRMIPEIGLIDKDISIETSKYV